MSRQWIGRSVLISFFAGLLMAFWQRWGVERFEGRIVDDATGQPVAATVAVSDADGKPLEIEGKHSHVEYLRRRRCYVDGTFVLNARRGRLKIDVRRGLETIPVQTEFDFTEGATRPLTVRLKRWISMRERGYLSGDTHVHYLSQSESHLQMRAEDLNVLNLLVSDITNDREKFTGKLDPGVNARAFGFRGSGIPGLAERARYPAANSSDHRAVCALRGSLPGSNRAQPANGTDSQRSTKAGRRHDLGSLL
jgi:hypothetical protein